MTIILRAYQARAVDSVRDAISQGNKKVVMALPTGAGKSIIFADIISKIVDNGKSVLWLVHRRNLVIQMRDTLRDFGIEPGLIMAGHDAMTHRPVQIGTQQTYSRRLKLDDLKCNKFFIDADVLLIDEGHRSISKGYQKIIDMYADKILIACTATPMRADGRGMGEVYDKIVDVVGVKELTDNNYLAPVKYFVPKGIDLEKIKIVRGDYDTKELGKRANKPKIIADTIEQWLKHGRDRQTIVFCVNVKHSIATAETFNSAGIPAAHLDARSNDEARDDVFRQLSNGDITVVCNVGLYQEGTDVPDIGCVVMARPTKSMGLYRQCCGRGLRVSSANDDCIIIDQGGVVEEHGPLDQEIYWTLDGKEKAWQKKKEKKEKKMVQCRACDLVFEGSSKCPDCGTKVKTFGKKVEVAEGELEEYNPKKNNRGYSWDEKRRIMGALVYYAHQKGYKGGWVKHSYRYFFSVWPNDARVKHVPPIKPEGVAKNILQYIIISKAKAYQKRMAA